VRRLRRSGRRANVRLLTAILASLCAAAHAPAQAQSAATTPAADVEAAANPAAELASFQVAEGFDVSLFASERDGIVKPIQMRFDAGGRLWVIGSTVYPQLEPGQTPNDKVWVLEDADRDGHAERVSVFADGLMIPTGIELGHGGVYLGHGTELLFLTDTDGDGRADTRQVLLRGFGTGDNHQNINSFSWGPGGELWMSQGLHTRSNVETPWGLVRLHQAGLWRLWPRRLRLDGYYGSAHEPQNPWGFVFTDWGEPIVLAGNNSSPIYPVPGLVRDRRDDPPPLIWRSGQGRKVSGGAFVATSHFPGSWQGALILGGYIHNAVWVVSVRENGAGFAFEDRPPLIRSSSRGFRPVDVKFGPDGALYICDWFNPIIGHYQASFRHPDRDKTHGRIWRVTARGRPPTQPPDLTRAGLAELLDATESTDGWTRHVARRRLADAPTTEVAAAVRRWINTPGRSEHALFHALGVLQSHEIVDDSLLERLCRAQNPGARAYAASVIGLWADRLPAPLERLRALIHDPHPRVRLQALVACARVPRAEAMELAASVADLSTDVFLDYAVRQVTHALKPSWLPAFRAGKLDLAGSQARLELLVRADHSPDTLEAVRVLCTSRDLPQATRAGYWALLADVGEPNDINRILELREPPLLARVLPSLTASVRARGVRPASDATDALRALASSTNETLQAEALALAGFWRNEALRSQAEATANSEAAPPAARLGAITALQALGGLASQAILARVAENGTGMARVAAIASLASLDLATAARLAALWMQQAPATPGPRSMQDPWTGAEDVFTAFLRRRDGAQTLTQALRERQPSPEAAAAGLRIASVGGRDTQELVAVLQSAIGNPAPMGTPTPAQITRLIADVTTKGDAQRGEHIFKRPQLGCLACHAVHGAGGTLGPDLGALGTAQTIEFIIGAVLNPQQEIKEGYLSSLVITKDGDEYQGYLVRETADEIVLRDALQNREVRLHRPRIQERRASGSVMPSGLVEHLSTAEFVDLIRYLSDLGKPR
jgi:putative heme-binding domain-containing protein